MCDVGQGDALVLRDRGGGVIVFDVGGDAELIDRCLADLAVTQITAIVFTHYHRDHVGGISGALVGATCRESLQRVTTNLKSNLNMCCARSPPVFHNQK